LAFVFDGFTIHACLSTNSVHPGQDYPSARLMIFFEAPGCGSADDPDNFNGPKKDLDPLAKYYNNYRVG
jgi:hypothetical protein